MNSFLEDTMEGLIETVETEKGIYLVSTIKLFVHEVAEKYDIQEIYLFGSYAKGKPASSSDIDLIVRYGKECRGLKRIEFQLELEKKLEKEIDVVNIDFLPEFFKDGLTGAEICIYRQRLKKSP